METKDEKFSRAIEFTLLYEGGHVNDSKDAGGENKYGISKARYPNLDITNLTLDKAKELYRIDYWDAFKCGELPLPIAIVFFDSVVQFAPTNPIRWLQRAVWVKDDGRLGPKTIEAAKFIKNPLAAARQMIFDRVEYRTTIRTYSHFGRGWRRRDIALMCEAARGWTGE
jgi:lysozyme family protein